MSWRVVPAVCKNVQFASNSDWAKFWRYTQWHGHFFRKYGMLYQDNFRYTFPEVREAVRRLSIREPHEYDARQFRIMRAHNLAMNNELLPKEQWTKFEEVRRTSKLFTSSCRTTGT